MVCARRQEYGIRGLSGRGFRGDRADGLLKHCKSTHIRFFTWFRGDRADGLLRTFRENVRDRYRRLVTCKEGDAASPIAAGPGWLEDG